MTGGSPVLGNLHIAKNSSPRSTVNLSLVCGMSVNHGESPTFLGWVTFWGLLHTLAILGVVSNMATKQQSYGSPSNWLRNLEIKPGNGFKC